MRPLPLILLQVTWKKTNSQLTTASFQASVKNDEKVFPELPLFHSEQFQFPQSLLVRLVLQRLQQLHCPSLDTVQGLSCSEGPPKL